jgi:hypothetical protein
MRKSGKCGVNPPYSIGILAEGNRVADPNPFAFRSGDLVSDPLADDFPFELGEGEQDIEGEPAHARGRVEGLRDRDGETPCSSKSSTSFAKSARDLVSRSDDELNGEE